MRGLKHTSIMVALDLCYTCQYTLFVSSWAVKSKVRSKMKTVRSKESEPRNFIMQLFFPLKYCFSASFC